jgi:hypothetical protein
MDSRLLARIIATGRLGFGAGLLLAPERLTRLWLGSDAARAGTKVTSRGLGARDLVLGLGALTASDRELRKWVAGAVIADSADLLATLTAGRSVPLSGRAVVGSLALGAAVLGTTAARGLSSETP